MVVVGARRRDGLDADVTRKVDLIVDGLAEHEILGAVEGRGDAALPVSGVRDVVTRGIQTDPAELGPDEDLTADQTGKN